LWPRSPKSPKQLAAGAERHVLAIHALVLAREGHSGRHLDASGYREAVGVSKSFKTTTDVIMKTKTILSATFVAALLLSASTHAFAQSNHFEELANQPFPENLPTKEATQTLNDELLFQRATQVYLWALPVLQVADRQLRRQADGG
jgi:hypothetical protein